MPSSTYKIVAKKQVEIESKISEDEMKKKMSFLPIVYTNLQMAWFIKKEGKHQTLVKLEADILAQPYR